MARALGALAWLAGDVALAQGGHGPQVQQVHGVSCPDARVHIQGELAPLWVEPVTRLCEEFGSLADLDPAVHLTLSMLGEELVVEAVASEGRTATRRVRAPEDLRLKVEALVRLPADADAPGEQAESQPSAATPSVSVVAKPAMPSVSVVPERGEPSHTAQPSASGSQLQLQSPLRIEVSVSGLGRVSLAPTYESAGVAAHAGLRSGAWLLALTVRWEPLIQYGSKAPREFEMDSLGAGFVVTRRVARAKAVELELGAATSLIDEIQSHTPVDVEKTSYAADVRVGLLSRLLLGAAVWRWMLWVESDVSPLRVGRNLRLDPELPRLPTWSIAIGLGVVWSES